MAEVFPFRALRYDPSRVDPARVVTQPYDKITPQMQESYYRASPYNLVRIILGKAQPQDDDNNNVYSRAAASFQQWRNEGVLAADAEPGFYAYSQTFTLPDAPGEAPRERRGFIGLGRLEDYESAVVFRHEQTLAKPKTDRLNLLRATRAHFGQIFMLYDDPQRSLDQLAPPGRQPALEVRDEFGVLHRVWRLSDPETLAAIQGRMRDKRLIIADGHHRYETALIYRDERRRLQGASVPDAPYERVMMTFINLSSPGVAILATHRVVCGVPGFEPRKFFRDAAAHFEVEEAGRPDAGTLLRRLREAGQHGPALAACTASRTCLLRAHSRTADALPSDVSFHQRTLDVVLLHRLLLERVLGISQEAVLQQSHIEYLRDAGEALRRVQEGADLALLMNAVPVQQVRDLAFAGEVLPQKSTDFYPKLLSGLTLYALD